MKILVETSSWDSCVLNDFVDGNFLIWNAKYFLPDGVNQLLPFLLGQVIKGTGRHVFLLCYDRVSYGQFLSYPKGIEGSINIL